MFHKYSQVGHRYARFFVKEEESIFQSSPALRLCQKLIIEPSEFMKA